MGAEAGWGGGNVGAGMGMVGLGEWGWRWMAGAGTTLYRDRRWQGEGGKRGAGDW